MPITKREHFNGWYSSSSYYLALFLSDLPITVVCSTLYVILIYVLTNQPLESFRLINVIFVAILTCLSAQAYGILIGSLFNVQVNILQNPLKYSEILIETFLLDCIIHSCSLNGDSHTFRRVFYSGKLIIISRHKPRRTTQKSFLFFFL